MLSGCLQLQTQSLGICSFHVQQTTILPQNLLRVNCVGPSGSVVMIHYVPIGHLRTTLSKTASNQGFSSSGFSPWATYIRRSSRFSLLVKGKSQAMPVSTHLVPRDPRTVAGKGTRLETHFADFASQILMQTG